jgi:hypothetical protein
MCTRWHVLALGYIARCIRPATRKEGAQSGPPLRTTEVSVA